MDSRLLNVVYDDPFDGNFTKYDNDTDFWSSGSDTMGMQLTETLHGILPIAPTDDFGKEDNANALTLQSNKNAFNYEDFAGQHLTAGGAIEIVTVDPNADGYDSDSDDSDDDDDDDDDDEDNDVINQTNGIVHNSLIEFDRQSQCSNLTFRTRTDSSSIGDYESHTSDYDDTDDDDDDDSDDDDDDDDDDVSEEAHNAYVIGQMGNMQIPPTAAAPHITQANLLNQNESLLALNAATLQQHLITPDNNDIMLDTAYHKNRTMSTNTINSDVDALGLNIDANNFDLAEFITKDDFTINPVSEDLAAITAPAVNTHVAAATVIPPNTQIISSSKSIDSDSESDIIVDVETVEADDDEDVNSLRKASELLKQPTQNNDIQVGEVQAKQIPEEDLSFVDNTTKDPSWSPGQQQQSVKKVENSKNEEKQATKQNNFPKTITLVPNKKQCDLLKGKFGKGKAAKITQKPAKPLPKAGSCNTQQKETKIETTPPITERKTGIGMGGKNLALLRYHERTSISEQSSEENTTPVKIQNPAPPLNIKQEQKTTPQKPTSQIVKKEPETQEVEEELPTSPQKATAACKRKLNLEEYKKRRSDTIPSVASIIPTAKAKFQSYKIPKLEDKTNSSNNNSTPGNHNDKNAQQQKQTATTTNTTTQKHSNEVKTVVKTLKEQQSQPPKTTNHVDPITEAKNKVLRMQELKKAQQMRIIDSTISAKVPRVTKLPPLREIVKDSPYFTETGDNANQSFKCHPDYEEIIIVSASCNTDISIPPLPNPSLQPVNTASRSLLKSSALLSTITNTFQKVKAVDNGKISTSSLIASIQDVVVKKTLPVENPEDNDSPTNSTQKSEQHGEDKIIMHLRKDRIRKRTATIAIQTDLQPEFPPLPLPKGAMQHKSRERMRKHRKRQYRKHRNDDSASLSSEYSSDEDHHNNHHHSDHSNSSSILRSRDNSSSSSQERMRIYDSAIGTGGYSSRSSRKHRSSMSSSSYSESLDREARGRRQRRTSYKQRSSRRKRSSGSPYSSSSYTSDSDRSRSPLYRRSRSRSNSRGSRSRYSSNRQNKKNFVDRNVSQPAVEERRIVYVGRIEQETTKDMLRRKFLPYGTIKQISIHYKDTGMKYGFVTFERSQDAFNAIDNSTRDPQINMYDVSFGGRRAFCRASYADLDNAGINTYQSYVFPQQQQQPKEEDSFEALLMKMKAKLSANKNTNSSNTTTAATTTTGATSTTSSSTSSATTAASSSDVTSTTNSMSNVFKCSSIDRLGLKIITNFVYSQKKNDIFQNFYTIEFKLLHQKKKKRKGKRVICMQQQKGKRK
ncbi:PGC-1 family member spargel [Musca autumnalis]|uniref:PGC-1 family member spargel n=1 Tax=Musca autumnalis TaxID=221902 RepID=UPI003CF9125D